MPQNEAGWRIEPPVSVPRAAKQSRAETAAAEPPDDPPGTRAKSQGLWVGPYAEFSVLERVGEAPGEGKRGSWIPPPLGEAAVGSVGLGEGKLRRQGQEGVELRVE